MRDQVNKLEKILDYLRQQRDGEFDQDEYIDVRTEVLTTFDNPPIAPVRFPPNFQRTINDIAIERKREIRDQINSLDEELQFLTEYESLLESDLNDIKNQQYDINVELNGPTQKAEEIVENLEDDDNNGALFQANIGGINVEVGGDGDHSDHEDEAQINVNIGGGHTPEEVEVETEQGGPFLQAKIGGTGGFGAQAKFGGLGGIQVNADLNAGGHEVEVEAAPEGKVLKF